MCIILFYSTYVFYKRKLNMDVTGLIDTFTDVFQILTNVT